MKKIAKILLVALIINLMSSVAYAGLDDLAEPESVDPTIITMASAGIN